MLEKPSALVRYIEYASMWVFFSLEPSNIMTYPIQKFQEINHDQSVHSLYRQVSCGPRSKRIAWARGRIAKYRKMSEGAISCSMIKNELPTQTGFCLRLCSKKLKKTVHSVIAVTVTDSLSTFLRVLGVYLYLSNVQTGFFGLVTFVATWRATSREVLWAPNISKYAKQNQAKQV